MRRWGEGPGLRAVTSLAVAVLVMSGCTGDDDSADETSTTPPEVATTAPHTTASASTDPPATTDAPTTTEVPLKSVATTATSAPTTTVLDEEALKAQIAEDYNEAYQLREEMYSAPTLDGLEERLAKVAVPGSPSYTAFEAFIRDLVNSGNRVAANEPDYSTVTAQSVELAGGQPYTEALVTGCLVSNQMRVDGSGGVISGGSLAASQQLEVVLLTPAGWLPSEPVSEETVTPGATECATA